ncbi:hypothetical protein G6F65_016239 [Rhizopus arrhizus]|nr:hypothetical protein G6F65_016239 [Rhizopus arrhizus]
MRARRDVAAVVLGDRIRTGRGTGITHVHQLQQLEAAGATDRADHFAGLHLFHHLRERLRNFIQAAPAQVAAFQRVGAVRIADGGGIEVQLALVQQGLHTVGLLLAGGDLVGVGAVGQGHQDVRQVVLVAHRGLLLQRGIDFALADADTALREALAQALHGDLVAHRGPEVVEVDTVMGQALAQGVQRRAVLLGDGIHRLVQLLVADPDAAALGAGDLQLDQHQALEHLAAEHVFRRQLVFTAGVLRLDVGDRTLELALQDHVLIDDGGDAVKRLRLLGKHLQGGGHAGHRQQRGEKNGEALGHGI